MVLLPQKQIIISTRVGSHITILIFGQKLHRPADGIKIQDQLQDGVAGRWPAVGSPLICGNIIYLPGIKNF
jgi:hypothetical protein